MRIKSLLSTIVIIIAGMAMMMTTSCVKDVGTKPTPTPTPVPIPEAKNPVVTFRSDSTLFGDSVIFYWNSDSIISLEGTTGKLGSFKRAPAPFFGSFTLNLNAIWGAKTLNLSATGFVWDSESSKIEKYDSIYLKESWHNGVLFLPNPECNVYKNWANGNVTGIAGACHIAPGSPLSGKWRWFNATKTQIIRNELSTEVYDYTPYSDGFDESKTVGGVFILNKWRKVH
jgi:hypothetical protein